MPIGNDERFKCSVRYFYFLLTTSFVPLLNGRGASDPLGREKTEREGDVPVEIGNLHILSGAVRLTGLAAWALR